MRLVSGVAVGMLTSAMTVASAQYYPSKPIRLVTSEVGGGNDFSARLIAQGLNDILPQRVIVENRAQASAEIVSRAQPDGYTLLVFTGTLWTRPLMRDMPFDPVRDFAPVTLVASSPNVLVVHPSVSAKSVKDLIALSKPKPGEFNFATGGSGSANHLAGELFKRMSRVNIVRINFRGTGPAVTGVVSGQVHMMFASPGSIALHVKSGKLNPLAVTSPNPSALFPGLPTVAADLPCYESETIVGVWAPTGTPAAIVKRLNQEVVRVLNQADVKERFFNSGVEIVGSSPDQLARFMKADIARISKLIKEAGIRDE